MCSSESMSQYNWYDGQVPGSCCNVCKYRPQDPGIDKDMDTEKSKDNEKDKDKDKDKENSEPLRNIQKNQNPNHILFIITEPDTRCP
jgi:hypothetical protein